MRVKFPFQKTEEVDSSGVFRIERPSATLFLLALTHNRAGPVRVVSDKPSSTYIIIAQNRKYFSNRSIKFIQYLHNTIKQITYSKYAVEQFTIP